MNGGLAALALAAIMLDPVDAAACATCTCGDPTLTVMGAQPPFAGRLRMSLSLQHRDDALGRGARRQELNEQQVRLGVAYAPLPWLTLSATFPLVRRELTQTNLARDTFVSAGDLEVRARVVAYRDRELGARHLLAFIGGMRLPTAPLSRGADGSYREPELQPGSGSFDPLGGISYAYFADPWSLYFSEIVYISTQGRADFQQGNSLRGSHALQYQLSPSLSLRAGANFRLEAPTRRLVEGRELDEPDSGGFVLFASPALLWSPILDLVLSLEVDVPAVNALRGTHDEGAMLRLEAVYDF